MHNKMVNFIQMVNSVSPEYSAHYDKFKLYAEVNEFDNIEIRIQFDDEDMYLADFFGEVEYLTDWVNYQFIIKKNGSWDKCNFKIANRLYNSGCKVRCEVDGEIEEFIKTAHELKCLVDVVSMRQIQSEWEYMI